MSIHFNVVSVYQYHMWVEFEEFAAIFSHLYTEAKWNSFIGFSSLKEFDVQ